MKREERAIYNSLKKTVGPDTIIVDIPERFSNEGKQAIHELLTFMGLYAKRIEWNSITNEYCIAYVPAHYKEATEKRIRQETMNVSDVEKELVRTDYTWNGYKKPDDDNRPDDDNNGSSSDDSSDNGSNNSSDSRKEGNETMKKSSNKAMTPAELETAKKAANEKRLETMRRNLSALENEAAAILEKGDAMTAADRARLLQLVNIAYHDSGKIEGLFSIDSCASCEFCQKMIKAAAENILMICGACYAARDAYKEAAWRRHSLNAKIFSSVLFSVDELRALAIPGFLCRFNEDGDTVNDIHARNYIRVALSHPMTSFGYFYKNSSAVEKGLQAEGITSREQLPKNVRFIHSSYLIGFPANKLWFDDAIFTVYPDRKTTAAAIENGSHACNGRKCQDCGFKCYKMQRQENVTHIAELLRCSNEKRSAILAAYEARKACTD